MVAISKLQALKGTLESVQHSSWIELKSDEIRNLILEIVDIVLSERPDAKKLDEKLAELSHFFRVEKFSTVVLPVLTMMAEKDKEKWEKAKHPERNERIKTTDFENFPKSTALVQDQHWNIESKFVRVRELVLLGIYGITQDDIGEAFFMAKKNAKFTHQ